LNRGIQTKLAESLGVTSGSISLVLSGKQPISRPMAVKLSELFGETPGFWIDADIEQLKRMIDQWDPRPETR
jgi:addiction module HigA family antidote